MVVSSSSGASAKRRHLAVVGAELVDEGLVEGLPVVGVAHPTTVARMVRSRPAVAWSAMPTRFYVETLGCPKNQVDSDKLVGTLLAEGMVAADDAATPTSSSSTPARSSRRPARSRSTPSWRWPTRASDGARLVVTGCMAERYGDELADALPEVDAVAGFGVPGHARRCKPGRPRRCPASTCSTCPGRRSARAVGLREDRRGLRPRLRVLRHPVVPRASSAVAHDRRRSSTRSTQLEVAGDRARRPGPGRRTARTTRAWAPAPSCRSCEAVAERVARVRLLYLYPSDLTDGLIDAICATGVPYFDLSLQHVSQAAAAAHAPLGRRRPVPAPHRRHPRPRARRRLPLELHRRLPGRDRGRPRPAAAPSSRRPSSTGAASSPTRRRTAPTPPTSTARSPTALVAERLAELRELQDAITAAAT